MQRIGFGGGCHWCTEAVFQALAGVGTVRQGFITSDPPDDAPSEAVEVDFDPARIALHDLVAVHLATHASTSRHKLRGKYRSAVYTLTAAQADAANAALARCAAPGGAKLVTRTLRHRGFTPSDPRFRDYYANDPTRPFCRTYIAPKMAQLRAAFGHLLMDPSESRKPEPGR